MTAQARPRQPCQARRPRRPAPGGFTLVELLVVLVVLSVLAAVAASAYADLSSAARRNAVAALAGSVRSAAAMGTALCGTSPSTCSLTAASTARGYAVVDGIKVQFSFGTPAPYQPPEPDQQGIWGLVETQGFTRQPYVSGSKQAIFTMDDAPDPSHCRVIYDTNAGEVARKLVTPSVSVDTAGC